MFLIGLSRLSLRECGGSGSNPVRKTVMPKFLNTKTHWLVRLLRSQDVREAQRTSDILFACQTFKVVTDAKITKN